MLSEEAFNPDSSKSNFKNLRLISHLMLPLKNIPFDSFNQCLNYQFLTNLSKTGQVACLNFKFTYQRQVPEEQLGTPIDKGGLLYMKMVQSEDFSFHHDENLDKHVFSLEASNETK